MKDICDVFTDIFKSDTLIGEGTNIGMNSEIPIGDLVILISDLMDTDITFKSSEERILPKMWSWNTRLR